MKNRPTGARNPRWNPARSVSSHGYLKERVGVGHPLADSKGWAYVHALVWAASGRPMPKEGETIHHVSAEKSDNRIENLALIPRAEHSRLHAIERRRRSDGRFAPEQAA
ncbi:HNH endonuclease [Gemmatimonas sp.]|uniref:HNH endonuclease n=1 Tax=Gemmatimonas sp. TaxID=1962908 RepID=UPI003341B4FE